MTYWFFVIFIQTWNKWISCLHIKIICIFTESIELLEVIPFLRSTSISIYPLLLWFFNLDIVDSCLMSLWILIIWIQTWNQRMSCIFIKLFWGTAKSSNFLEVIPFFRSSSISIYPPLLFFTNLSIIYSNFMSYWVLVIWI